ncbi:MAG: helix-turn-helix protein [Evtepia sp.]|jgi:transcriptional regulator with XRE-family HTH domain|nr:helix-turn-helix protein [Evtepia sp.]
MDILKEIENMRLKRGWSIYTMAKECGLDQSTISAWYHKGRKPSVESLEKLCEGFGITMSRFFAVDDELITLTREQRELLNCWDALSKKQKVSTLQLIKDMPNID